MLLRRFNPHHVTGEHSHTTSKLRFNVDDVCGAGQPVTVSVLMEFYRGVLRDGASAALNSIADVRH